MTEADAELARANDGWVHSHLRGARVVGESWYAVKFDGVPKRNVMQDAQSAVLRPTLAAEISEENQVQITQVKWISKSNVDKHHGSMIVKVARKEDAVKLLQDHYVSIKGETVFAREYVQRASPTRCYKC